MARGTAPGAVVVVGLPALALPVDGQVAVAADHGGAVVGADPGDQQQALLAPGQGTQARVALGHGLRRGHDLVLVDERHNGSARPGLGHGAGSTGLKALLAPARGRHGTQERPAGGSLPRRT